jgi:hypothetical protein
MFELVADGRGGSVAHGATWACSVIVAVLIVALD